MKIMVLVIAMSFALSVIPSFTMTGNAEEEKSAGKSMFQVWANWINTPLEMEVKPLKKVDTFQHMSDGIKEGSQKAKKMSLRTEKTQ